MCTNKEKTMKLVKMITLLAIVTLFAGCNMVQGPEKSALKPVLSGGEKISRVEVTIGGNARAILPTLDGGFSKYILSAEPASGNTATAPSPVPMEGHWGGWGTISVLYGEWIITVTAYVNVGGEDYPAAKGSVPLTVSESSHSITVPVNTPEPGGTGTFTYTVRYPSAGTASVKFEPWPLGQPALFNEAATNGGQVVKNNIASGMYFLTISATANAKTVTRSEIVHIYQHSTSNAEYVFTKVDFGGGDLNLSGTVKVLLNGEQPEQAQVSIRIDNGNGYGTWINFTGNDGSGTWSIFFDSSYLMGANTLSFRVGLDYSYMVKELFSIPLPVDDTTIDLGTVAWNIIPLPADTWVDGEITTSDGEDYYSINVIAGEMYHFWLNNIYGDGTKTLHGHFEASYSNGNYTTSNFTDYAWNNPAIFIANNSGMVSGTVYIRVYGGGNTGTYAIAYSTNSHWHNNSFNPVNAVPLTPDVWFDGEITEYYADGYWGTSTDWYSINVTAETTYYFWFNNGWYGDGTKTLEGNFGAYYSNGYHFLDAYGNAWNNPASFTAISNGTIYIRVWSNNSNPGTYAIAYSTERFNNPFFNAVPLPSDTWAYGESLAYNDSDWYSINVTTGTTYYFWFNNGYDGDGTKTLEGYFTAYYSNGNNIFGGYYPHAWNNPMSFTAYSSGTVYIDVHNFNYNPGTYAIAYSTGTNRPSQ